jgi:putative ABC transport system permease protein
VIAITAIAILGGAAFAVRRASSLNPADAMTQPPPPDYSKAAGMGITRWHRIDQQTRMILRQIIRWPVRASLTMAGVAASGALLIGTMFFIDSMTVMMDGFFNVSNRYDVSVTFVQPRPLAAYHSLERMPGVLAAEPFRAASARLRHGHLEERAALIGAPLDPQLARMVDAQYRTVSPPPGGLVLSQDLATKLDVEAGDMLEIHIAEGRRPLLNVPVSAVTTTLIGSGVQMRIGDLNALLGEGDIVSGAYLIVDPDQVDTLYTALKSVPLVAGTGLQSLAAQNLDDLMQQNLGTAIWIYTGFAGLIALGVIYNSVRISFAERQRELASLRVLGFTVADVSYILLGEVAFLTLLALPVAAAAGTAMAWYLAQAMSSQLFRLPFVIHASTFGLAGALLVGITIGSSLLVRHQIERLDMVAVLKTGE